MSNLFKATPKFVSLYKTNTQVLTKIKCYYSTEQAVKTWEEDERNKQLMKDFEKITNLRSTKKTRKPQKPPFLKNIFLGKYDTDVLAYPQFEKTELETLDKSLESTETYFRTLQPLQKPPELKSDFMENLRRLQLFGLQGPQLLDARELDVTEDCRFNDVWSGHTSMMMGLLCNEKLVFQALLKHGTDDIKKKYLPGLISGKTIGAFCVGETDPKGINIFNTTATFAEDKKVWILNGTKSMVVNGDTSNLLLVLAKTPFKKILDVTEYRITLFIVEKDFGGIITEPCDPMGLAATNIANVKFNNTHIPPENIVGLVNNAELVLPSILTDFRLGVGPACTGILRQLIDKTVNFCTNATIEGKSLAQAEYVQSVMGQLTVQLYAMESMNYLTSLLMDQYENQDCQMEAMVVKIFNSQETCAATLQVMELLGPAAYEKGHWCNALHRDALSYLFLHEPSENLKLTLSLTGLQYTGINIQEKVKKLRNPLFFPADAFKRIWTLRNQIYDKPKLIFSLNEYLHPSLGDCGKWLEYCVLRFEYAVECMLIRLGKEIINNHMELMRLSECLIDIYAMTACLGRASRAYCIGLAHADLEMTIANSFCYSAHERVRDKLNKLINGSIFTNDENYKRISENTFKLGKYFPVHPLSRNY